MKWWLLKKKDLEENLQDSDHNQKWDQLYSYEEKLNELVGIKTQGAIMRSRQQWYEESEKFMVLFNLEKRNSNWKSVHRLELNNTNITEYLDVFSMKRKCIIKNFTGNNYKWLHKISSDVKNINKVTDEDYTCKNKELTEAELLKIVKSLPSNKTQGEDILPSGFYKMFWWDIPMCLFES